MRVKLAMVAALFAVATTAQQSARIVSSENQRFSNLNVNDLFGARDLRIVEVFDVASDKKTQHMCGRIYYVEQKALIFYAFDVQNIKGNGTAFQAWGYHQLNEEKPESLGVFSMDDASQRRWVLRVSDPRILEHLEAIFVTVEGDPKGSPFPRGQKMMYAKLPGLPNPS